MKIISPLYRLRAFALASQGAISDNMVNYPQIYDL